MTDVPPNRQTVPWWATWVLACVVLIVFSAMAGIVLWRTEDASQYAQSVVVAVVGLVTGATGYYFGSSSGSDKKDSTNREMAAALATSAPVAVPAPADTDADTAEALNAAELLRNKLGAAQP